MSIESLSLAKKLLPAFLRGLGLCDLPSNSSVGVARSGLIVCKDPDAPKRRLLGVSKCNLCQPPAALRYEVIAEGKTSPVVWQGPPGNPQRLHPG